MERLLKSQENLRDEFKKYNNQTKHKLPPLVVNDTTNLSSLLSMVTARHSHAHIKKEENKPAGTMLKSAIADVLLLLDGFDMKQKHESDNPRVTPPYSGWYR